MGNFRTEAEFYYHEKFGKVPVGWEIKTFDECFNFFPTASYSRSTLTEQGDCHYIHYGDIHTKFNVFLDFQKHATPFVSKEMAKRFTKLKDGDLIMADASEDYDGVGKTVEVVNLNGKHAIAGLHTLHLRCKEGSFVKGFTGYVLNNEKVRHNILRSATGIKVYSVSKSGLKRILLPKPPEVEQTAIAAILSKVDAAITSTENSIHAAERLRKALMQNLLTGKLKFDGTWRTEEELQSTKIGKLPKNWQVRTIKELSKQVTDGEHSTPERSASGYYLLSARNIKNGYLDLSNVDFVPENVLRKIQKRCNPQEGDILISCSGTIGNVCTVPKGLDAGMVRSAALVKLKRDEIEPEFIEMVLQSYPLQNQMKIAVVSSAQGNIFQGAIKKLKVPYPPTKEERDAIVGKINSFSIVIKAKRAKIQTLQRIKKSLMQNLLTGKIRLQPEVIKMLVQNEDMEVIENAAV